MRKTLILLAATTACAIWITSTTTAAVAGKAKIGSFGFDITGMDRGTPPGNDFYEFANGAWDKATAIPPDKSNYGMFTMLEDLSSERSRQILEEQAKTSGSKIGDLYAAFMDEAAIQAAGMRPLQATLAQLRAVKNKSDWAAEIGGLLRTGVRGPFAGFVTTDDKAPTQMIFRLSQSGLGLPDRDYYLKNEPALAHKKAAYQTYLTQLLTLTGEANAAARAGAVLAFETKLAEVHWTRIESRDDDKTYNKWALADLPERAPGFDWPRYIAAIGASSQPNVIVSQPSAFERSAKLIDATPLDVLKDYLTLRFIDHAAPYLSSKFVEANFAFHGTVLNGTPENEPRWKRGVSLVERVIPDDLSRLYVARFFPPEAKAKADELVKNVIAAMDRRLAGLTWMAPETKQKARAKLAAFTPKIGYSSKWRDYSPVVIKRGDLLGSVRSASEFEYRRNLAKLGKPVDRTEWFMTPMTVNAYANPTWNEVVFPAAILQPPFFDPNADPAVNYGGIGAVIGHEISHHFDDQGRKYDMTGALREWWTPEDVKRFDALTSRLVTQYDAYEPLPGKKVQGKLTLGENIADLAGLTVAYDAYKMALGGKPAPVIDGFSGDQRFYLSWAQVWRRKYREENLLQRLLTDPHSPSEQRVAVVRNLDPWYAAFEPKSGDGLFLTPEQRIRIW